MHILGVIPARAGSKRLKGKNVLPLMGRPMICHTIDHVRKSALIDRVVCSTDSTETARIAKRNGCEVIRRPKNISQDHSRLEDALIHAIDYLEQKDGYKADIVVILLPNIPIRQNGIIDKVVKRLIATKADSVFTVENVGKHHPLWMVKKGKDDKMVRYVASSVFRGQDLPPLYINNGAVWAVWSGVLKKKIERSTNYSQFGKDMRIIIQDRYNSIDIDDKYDLLLAEAIMKNGRKRTEHGNKKSHSS